MQQPWHQTITRPKTEQLNRVGASNWKIFCEAGSRMAPVISQAISKNCGPQTGWPRTLDFGCGVGRVFLPLHHDGNLDLHGCDIDPAAVHYLRDTLGISQVHQSSFDPPLRYPDNTFDVVYSVSIWTHLPPEAGEIWLREIKRVLRPGGVALITTSGFRAMESRRKRGTPIWRDMSDDDLRRSGILYREYDGYAVDPERYPGVTASYGLTAHDPDWIRREWSAVMPVRSIEERAIDNVQDLVTMVKV